MGAMGGFGGVTIGVVTSQGTNLVLNLIAKHLGGKGFTLFITPLWFIGFIMILSIFIGIGSGFLPAHRASKLSPKEAFLQR